MGTTLQVVQDNDETGEYKNESALDFHKDGKPGKVQISATKPLMTQSDLALAYSPGVAAPCLAIAKNPDTAYDYTARGNFVAVISNGTAVLGLGDLGALASKPVMEGKAVLFKRFADIDGIDIEVDTSDPDEFINAVKYLGPSWGGINLEDIKAPDCFIIESKLKELMDIPVFHDDQHGTAIVTASGLINACHLANKKIEDLKLVVLGAGSAGIACLELAKSLGVKNALLVDRQGVVYKGRKDGMNQWKSKHAIETDDRTLEDAMKDADAFYGLAGKGAVNKEMVASMADNPIIFAMANPDPEITPDEVREVRKDGIIATGRSDYNNQVNNVLGFPYIFRGALDCRASKINEEMKVAAAYALAELARQPVPEEVAKSRGKRKIEFGPEYIIPSPFDPRLISTVPVAVAKAAEKSGVAKQPIEDYEVYRHQLEARLNPTANTMNLIYQQLKAQPRTCVFSEGEEETSVRTALDWRDNGYGEAILVGREKQITDIFDSLGVKDLSGISIQNAALSTEKNQEYIEFMYNKLQRKGFLYRDCVRLVKNDRNTYAACMLACEDADLMMTGLTRTYNHSLKSIMRLVDAKPDHRVFGLSIVVGRNKQTVYIADTSVDPTPTPESYVSIAKQSAAFARQMGVEPRVALLSFSNFGNPMHEKAGRMREAVNLLDQEKVDFEYEGEITADVALNPDLAKLFPFCRLSGPANILIMPGLHTAHIASKLVGELGGVTLMGPVLMGLEKPAQIVPMNSGVGDILNLAALGAASQAVEA